MRTSTAELSDRALFKSACQNAKGEIVVETHDRIAAINALNAMQDGALAATSSFNMNVNALIAAARYVYDPDAALRLFDAFGDPSTAADWGAGNGVDIGARVECKAWTQQSS